VGETKLALDLVNELLETPNGLTTGTLRAEPEWDPIRTEKRFHVLAQE
jgi:hypothetical protein